MVSISCRIHMDFYIQTQNAFPVSHHFKILKGYFRCSRLLKSAKPCPWFLQSMRSGVFGMRFLWSSLWILKKCAFLEFLTEKKLINEQCDLGNLSRPEKDFWHSRKSKCVRTSQVGFLASTLTGCFRFPHLKNRSNWHLLFILQLAVG